MTGNRVGRFRSQQAGDRFLELYDRAVAELWPVPSDELDIETGFGTTHVRRSGSGGRYPIVLIHGHSGTSVGWSTLIAGLAERHTVYTVDVIGTLGRSVQTRPIEDAHDLSAWFRDLAAGLGEDRVHLVGFSEGGFVAFHAALGNQERVVTVVAIDPAGTIENVRIRFLGSMVWAGIKTVVGVPNALRKFGEHLTPGVVLPDIWWDMVTAGAKGFRHALPMPRKMPDDDLRRMTTPTLLYMAGASEIYDAERAAARARSLMPDVEIVIVEGAQHGLPLTHPERTWTDVLDFVDRHEEDGG